MPQQIVQTFLWLFLILENIGKTAYKLQLPKTAHIHPVFHISVLKWCPDPTKVTVQPFPSKFVDGRPLFKPLAVLASKHVKVHRKWQHQVLIRWEGCDDHNVTWEELEQFKTSFPDFNL